MSTRNPNLRKSAFAGFTSTKGSGVFSAVGIHNDSKGPELVVIHHYEVSPLDGTAIGFYTSKGALSTKVADPVTAIPGEPKPAGNIQAMNLAALPAAGWRAAQALQSSFVWPHEYPVVALQPDWCFVVFSLTANNAIDASFWWEAVEPDDLWQLFGTSQD